MSNRLCQLHRKRIENFEAEAAALSGTMAKAAAQAREVLVMGGTLAVQSQMLFAVGAIARLMKDLGVVEQLQQEGATQKPAVHLNGDR